MRLSRIFTAFKAVRQLGPEQVALNALYRLGLASGHYRRSILPPSPAPIQTGSLRLHPLFSLPAPSTLRDTLGEAGLTRLCTQADEIAAGNVRLFGAEPLPLRFDPSASPAHWTAYETGRAAAHPPHGDIKFIWEPARFGWAFTLGRAYHLTGSETYPAAFWRLFEDFERANPPYFGPNWMSAQEVGLRLLAYIWAAQVFAPSAHSSPARLAALAISTAAHAARIPATLPYARSQNNNHLLTEAAALYTASLALPTHPLAANWQRDGCKWLDWCFTRQIDTRGEYVQHSSNYHRLMLHTALWLHTIQDSSAPAISTLARQKLTLASHWLLQRLDPASGGLPNLGANDGALILPHSSCDFDDYRPLAQAAARAFLGCRLPPGPWDELSLWLNLPLTPEQALVPALPANRLHASHSWADLRAVNYTSRPSHADQLHLDLWWRGLNLARDAGTFFYNAPPPWDNQLTSALVHNTITVNALDQMTRAGRFLYLDWPAAELQPLETGPHFLMRQRASSQAYARLGLRHQRTVTVFNDQRWLVQDDLKNTSARSRTCRLHWLLPDWEWKLDQAEKTLTLALNSPHGWLTLAVSSTLPLHRAGLLRAGDLLTGQALLSPVFGWHSSTYSVKVPALSLAIEVQSTSDFTLTTEFTFPALPDQD